MEEYLDERLELQDVNLICPKCNKEHPAKMHKVLLACDDCIDKFPETEFEPDKCIICGKEIEDDDECFQMWYPQIEEDRDANVCNNQDCLKKFHQKELEILNCK